MKNQILEVLPSYLKENEYFISIFNSLIDGVTDISVSKHRNGHYFFTPFQNSLMDYSTFSLFVSNKGIADVSMQKEEPLNTKNHDIRMRSSVLVSSIKKEDDSYSITSRYITVPKIDNCDSFEKRQFLEKREYDSKGNLLSKKCNSYIPEEVDYNSTNVMTWDNDVSLEKGISYFYSDDFAIAREYRRILDTDSFLPQYDEKRYCINYLDGKEKDKREISEEEYQELYYDIAYKNKIKSDVKKLEKRF